MPEFWLVCGIVITVYVLGGLAFYSWLSGKSAVNDREMFRKRGLKVDGRYVPLVILGWPRYFWVDYKQGQKARWVA